MVGKESVLKQLLDHGNRGIDNDITIQGRIDIFLTIFGTICVVNRFLLSGYLLCLPGFFFFLTGFFAGFVFICVLPHPFIKIGVKNLVTRWIPR